MYKTAYCTCSFGGTLHLASGLTLIRFGVTYSFVLHTFSKLVTLWVNSNYSRQLIFTSSIKGKSSILSSNRCYGLQPLMTALSQQVSAGFNSLVKIHFAGQSISGILVRQAFISWKPYFCHWTYI